MIAAVSIPTGWFALLALLAWVGLACSLVFVACCGWCALMRGRGARVRRRQGRARPGPVPTEVTRSFREPYARLPNSGVSTKQLEAWYAQPARDPRR